jgi:hypothetical protein
MIAVLGVKAAACGHLSRIDEGRECARRYAELCQWSTVGTAKTGWGRFMSPEFLATFVDGLRKAGLPEG